MKIYQLTPLGKRLARSVSNPDTEAWRVVHYLDRVGRSTPDQIAMGASMPGSAAGVLVGLRNKGVVAEIGGDNDYSQRRF